jgi:PadR family transcriptional regulator, regulatory protein PadR
MQEPSNGRGFHGLLFVLFFRSYFVYYKAMRSRAPATLPPKERLILELLVSSGPMYGLQLVEQSAGALKRGTVYVTLGRLEAKGLVVSELEPRQPGAIGLPRRIYRITGLGERVLRAWTAFARELAWERP